MVLRIFFEKHVKLYKLLVLTKFKKPYFKTNW